MTEIKFNVNQFKPLIDTAKSFSKDGIDESEKVKLLQKANEDGTITEQERLFIKGLDSDVNLKTVNDFKSKDSKGKAVSSMTLDIDNYKEETASSDVIKGATYKDIGINKFNFVMKDKNIKPDTLKTQILDDNVLKNNKNLADKVNSFMTNIGLEKEGLLYLKELVNRDPKLSPDKLEKVMDKLNEMVKANYDSKLTNSGYSAKSLAISALHDISAPSNISQKYIGSCAGTTVQSQLALKNPLEYLKMVDSLAKNQSHKEFQPNWTFTKEGLKEDSDTGRNISSKVMQNAIMDVLNESDAYDSTNLDSDGAGMEKTVKALNSLLGTNLQTYKYEELSNNIIEILKASKPSKNNPIQMSMSYEKKGRDSLHAVNVIGMDKNNVTIINPWGREETFPIKELENKIMKINAPKGLDSTLSILTKDQVSAKDSVFNRNIMSPFTDGISNVINNPNQRTEFLKNMSVEQKIDLIKKLNDSTILTDGDKTAMLKILENLFDGSANQDRQIVYKIWDNLIDDKAAKLSLPKLLDTLKTDNSLYNNVATQIYESLPNSDSDKARMLGKVENLFNPSSKLGKEYMGSLIKNSDNSEVADYATDMVKMYISSLNSDNLYTVNTLAKDSINNFLNKIKSTKSEDEYKNIMFQVTENLLGKDVSDNIDKISNSSKKSNLKEVLTRIFTDSGTLK